jgi:transcriptional regulator GlxA family with amidase domain
MEYRIFTLKAQILQDLQLNWTVEKMTEMTNLSKEHFHKLFKKEVGASPIQFLRHLRLEKAKELLETTNLRVKEIIREVGIRDQTHFVRDFKAKYGFPPNEYRQRFWDHIQAQKANS